MARRDPKLAALYEKFVCVRLVRANGLDLTTFQYDYDLSFVGFFLNANGTIYGRFGTRSADGSAGRHFTLASLRKSMAKALEFHAGYPANRASLRAKRGPAPGAFVPEALPGLRRFKSVDPKHPAKNCIHCHQVAEAIRRTFRDRKKPIPEELLRPWPTPEILGLEMDPEEVATVADVTRDSPAARARFGPGDEILFVEGQAILSVADIQWVLQHLGKRTRLRLRIRRDGDVHNRAIDLSPGWRDGVDISWRVSSWDLRRMILGGLRLRGLTAMERMAARIPDGKLGLSVKHVGKHGAHAVALRAGFRVGDVIVSFAGVDRAMSESDLLIDGVNRLPRGAKVPVVVLRNGRREKLTLRIQ